MFVVLGGNPFLGIVAGALVTAIIQSSSASVGILQSLAAAGLVPFNAAIYIIMGQNIGTCVTAMLSSVGAKRNAKTAAIMHLLFNIIGTIIFSVLAIVFFQVIRPDMGSGIISQTQISAVHTAFNICTTVLLFPVSDLIIKLAKKIGRVEEEEQNDDSKVLLDERMLETPGLALQTTLSEISRMGHIVEDTLEKSRNVMFTKDFQDIMEIKEMEDKVDRLCGGITEYVIKISTLSISEKEHEEVAGLFQILSDMERISDYCENVSEFAETLYERKAEFSEIGKAQMKEMIDVCIKSYHYALLAFESQDPEMAMKVIEEETKADDLEVQLRSDHMQRMANGQCATDPGIVFLDALVCMERISDHARNIAEELLTETK